MCGTRGNLTAACAYLKYQTQTTEKNVYTEFVATSQLVGLHPDPVQAVLHYALFFTWTDHHILHTAQSLSARHTLSQLCSTSTEYMDFCSCIKSGDGMTTPVSIVQPLADLGRGGPCPLTHRARSYSRFGETRNRQIITIICLLLTSLSFCIWVHWLDVCAASLLTKLSSLQFIKFIASLLYGNLSLCCAVVSKSAVD